MGGGEAEWSGVEGAGCGEVGEKGNRWGRRGQGGRGDRVKGRKCRGEGVRVDGKWRAR